MVRLHRGPDRRGLSLATLSSVDPDSDWASIVGPVGWFTALIAAGFGIPVATAFAILRHRLYDIDVVIKRTLVYGALTATLAAAYLGERAAAAARVQPVLGPRDRGVDAGGRGAVPAGAQPHPGAASTAASTAAPTTRTQTVESFGARLRDQVSLETLSDELRGVVHDTVQPAHVSVWLREPAR